MKTIISAVLISASLATSVFVFAHENERGTKHDRLVEKLNLSDTRSEEVKLAMKDFYDKKKEIRQNTRERLKELREQQKAIMGSLLTDEEMAVLMGELEKNHGFKKRHHKRRSKHSVDQ